MQPTMVIKRDGILVPFDENKIKNAILKSIKSVQKKTGKTLDETISKLPEIHNTVMEELASSDTTQYDVEYIQECVESALIKFGQVEVSKEYIRYRQKRNDQRKIRSAENAMIGNLMFTDPDDMDAKKENANVDGRCCMGSMLQIAGASTREYTLVNCRRPEHAELHRSGKIHEHDLDFASFTANCLQIPLDKLLREGFNTGHGSLRTPSNINSAATLTCIAIQSNQNDMFGGQSIPYLDWALAPYVAKTFVRNLLLAISFDTGSSMDFLKKKFLSKFDDYILEHSTVLDEAGKSFIISTIEDDATFSPVDSKWWFNALTKTESDTFQSMEALVHNLCTLSSRSGGQVPFSSVNFGTNTTVEGRMVMHALLDAIDKGLGNGETVIFPISIMKLKKGITDAGSPNHDIFKRACEVSAKRLYPNFENIDAPYNLQYYQEGKPETEVATMGCVIGDHLVLTKKDGYLSFKELWDRASDYLPIKQYGKSSYIDCSDIDLYVWDSFNKKFVKVLKIIRNNAVTNWLGVTIEGNIVFTMTTDHPLPLEEKGRTEAGETGVLYSRIRSYYDKEYEPAKHLKSIIGVNKVDMEEDSFDIETESDRFDLFTVESASNSIVGIQSHNCRTRVIGNIHDETRQITPGRGNIFPVTINLPYLALELEEKNGSDVPMDMKISNFKEALHERLHMVFDLMMDRFAILAKKKAKNFPFLMCQHLYLDSEKLGPDDSVGEVLKHGTLTVGFIGLAETLKVLTGKHHGESKESQEIGLDIISFMDQECKKEAEKTKLNFSLMGSPAEGCCGRLLRLTRKRFGVIPGVTDHEYLTNSSHIPVYFPISAYDKVSIEAPYHALCPAGHIGYIELDGDPTKNVEAFMELVEFMAEKNMGYFSINHPVDRDPICGYVGIIGDTCPRCGRHDNEGVDRDTLTKLVSYHPDPAYDARKSCPAEYDETVPNMSI